MKSINTLYVPYDSGHKNVRMGGGPLHLQTHSAAARLRSAGFEVTEKIVDLTHAFSPEVRTAFELHRLVGDAVREALAAGAFPLVVARTGAFGHWVCGCRSQVQRTCVEMRSQRCIS